MGETGTAAMIRASAPSTARKEWIDLTRGAAIICVVYFHATLFLAAVGVDHTLGRAKAVFELFPLPAFFLIAGILASRGVVEGTFGDLARRRLLPLAYVYVLWSLLRFAMFALFPALPSRDTDIAPGDPLSLALLPVLPASVYWFLYALLLFLVVAWLVRRVPRWIVVPAAAVVSALFSSGLVNTGTIVWNRVGALAVFFVAGVFFARELATAVERSRPGHLVAVLGAFGAVAATMALFRGLTGIPGAVLVGQCAAVAAAMLVARRLERLRALSFVAASGRASLAIYLVHLFAIAPLAYAVGLLQPDWPAAVNIATAAAVAAVAILAGFALVRAAAVAPWLIAPLFRLRSREKGMSH